MKQHFRGNMSGVTKAITAKVYKEVEIALSECIRHGDVSKKLQAIKSAKKFGIKHVSEVFETSRVSVTNWIKGFAEHGVDGLKLKRGRGRKSIISSKEEQIITEWIKQDSGVSIKALKLKIESELGKELCRSATHNLMIRLGYAYITPRPTHHKQHQDQQAEFKKKSTRDSSQQAK